MVISNDLTFDSSDDVVNLTDDGTYYWASINPNDEAYLAFATTTPGFTLSKSALTIGENAGTGTFTVVLDAEPLNDVVFKVTSDDTNEATVEESTLTFTTANWNTLQTVTVTGVNDNIDRNDNATITVSVDDASSDDYFDALDDQTVAVTLTNDDTAGFTVSETNLTVPENAGTGTFTVVLNTEPITDVVLDVVSDKTAEATVSAPPLTFTSENWDTPQTVTVTGVDDDIDRDDNATITVSVDDASSDDTFDALDDQTVAVTLTNDDQTITFDALADKTYGDADFNLTGTASSGLTVTYTSSDTDVATVSGNTVTILGAGTTTITASQAGDDDYNAASNVQHVLTVGKADQTITFSALDDKTYGDADFNLTGTASSGLTVTYTSSNTDVATVSGNKVTIVGAGTTTITASQAGDDDYNAASNVQHVLTVGKADQTITFSALDDKTYGDADFNLTGTASSGLTVTYTSSNTDVATVSGNKVTIVGAGTTTITASQAGDDDYNAASNVQHVLTVGKADQTITFSALDDKTYGDADFNLTGTASSGLTVTYTSSNTDVATVSDSTVTILGAGTTTITASQAGDDDYNAASNVQHVLTVGKADQTITFSALDDKTYGDADFNLTGTASSGLTVTYTSSNTDVATVSGNKVTIVGAGTTTITASQAGDDDYNAASNVQHVLTVGKADQTITFSALDDKTYGDADFNLTGTASSGLTVTYTSSNTDVATVSGNKVTIVGAGTTTITASQAGDDDYNAASNVQHVLTVGKADQTITFSALDDKTYGDADFNLTGTASSGLTVTYTSSDTDVATVSGNTVTIVGAGTTTITASQAGDDDYNAASNVQHVLTVGKADQTITFTALDDKTYGDANFDLTGTASSELTVSYASSNTDVATVSGNTVTIIGAGTTTITASQSGNDNYNAASDVQQELTVNAVNQTITFTALDDKTYGDADFNLTGTASSGLTVTYTSSNTNVATVSGNKVTIVGAGIATITASQAGDDNYSVASNVQQELKVRKKVLTVTAADKLKTYGEDNPELTFTYSGFVNGDNESDLIKAPVASTEATAASVAGNYKITVAGGVDENYDFTYNDATLTIEKATLTVTATAKDKGYDGTTTASITLSDDRVSGDMLTINTTSAEFEDKNVGEGKAVTVSGIILSGTDANNYQLASKTASATADITQKDLTVNNAVAHNKVYDGTTDAVTTGAVLKGVVSNDNVELENESVGIFAQSTVGNDIEVTTLMTINGADAANYSLVQPSGLKADITEKELIITGTFTVSDKEYEGAMDATIATNNLDLSGILGEDEVTLTNVVAAFETASAGNGLTVNIVSADLTGDDADQYSLSLENSPTATASIWKKTATVTGASGITKTYDGNKLLPSEMVAYEELNGILSEDETQVELTGNPLFDLADAGDRVIVQGNLKLTGPKADNYSLVWTDGTGKIEKATLIVEVNNDAKFVTQDDENNYAGVSISGYVNGENNSAIDQTGLTIIRNNATENIAGEYTDVLEASGLLADNYVFTYLSGDYSIIPAHELLVEINDTSIVYSEVSTYGISSARYLDSDGNTIKELTENITALNNNQFSIDDGVGNTVNFSINEINPEYNSLSNRLAVGSYQLEATEVSGSSTNFNNTIHVTGALTVTTKEVEVQIVSGSERKAFDGDANMDNLDMFTSDLVAGDDVELSGNGSFSQSEAGTDIAYSVTFALQGADKDNYHLKTDVPITGNDGKIAQIELIVIEAKASNKVYDGTTTATITGATLNGAVTGDDVTLANGNTGTFVTDAVGNDIEVLTSMTLAGADKDNYVLIQPTGLKANIEPQELAVTNAAAKNKVYDGTTNATIVDATLSGVVADDEVLLENAESGTFKQDIVGTEIEVTTAMTISGVDASNYKLIQPIGITADITTRELTVKDAVAENKVYDGTVNAVVSGAVLDGYVSGDDVILANSTVGTFMQNSVGENIQVVTLMTLEGDDKDNYTLKQPSYLTANITAAELTLSGSFVVNNKEYDGTAIATMLENNLQFNGLASGDIVSLDSIILAFETSNAGTGLEVYITGGKITGSDAFKYSFSLNGAPVTSASINKKELTVTADDKTKEYDGSGYSSFTVSYNGFIDGEDETNLSGALSFTGTATTAINAGTDYTITPGGLSSENYAIIYVDGYLDIHKVDQTITFNPISQQILSNSSFELSAVASSGLTVEYSSSDESIATVSGKIVRFINSGTCTIYANQPGNVNYNAAEQVLQTLTIIPYISGDSNHDGKITPPEIAGDSNEDGQINDGEVAGDTNGDGQIGDDEVAGDTDGNGQIDDDEVAGDNNGDGKITELEVAGDTDGNGQIDDDEVAGDNNGDGKITEPEVAGDTDGNGQIDDDEVAGDNNGDGKITEPEVAGDTDGNGQIDDDEVAGDNNGDGKITEPEVAGDTDGNGQIDDDEVAGDNNGDGKISEPEVAGDTDGNGQIDDDEVAGDNNGDGKISEPEVAGDTDGNGQIDDDEVAGDNNGDGTITAPEVSGDTNGDGQVTSPEIIGDTDGNGIINDDEVTGDRNGDGTIGSGETAGESETGEDTIAGDVNGDGQIGDDEIAGDTDGDGTITAPEVAGDTNGDGQIGDGEIAGDTDGDGTITDPEVAGDTNGDGQIGNGEIAGDTDGDGQITDPEVAGDTDGNGQIDDDEVAGDNNGDGKITAPEVAGDTDGNGQIDDDEVAGDNNGDGKITEPEVAGDTDGNGQINDDEVAGDNNGDGKITEPEVAGDTDGNGQIDDDEVAGDNNGDGKITEPEVAGDTDGNGQIDDDEVAGDNNGDGKITEPEVAGDTDGNGQINDDEVAGDNNGDGQITEPEVAGDTDGNGQIDDDEIAGDNNGDGQITEPEVAGDTDGNGQIDDDEVAGDTNGDGKITDPEVAGDTNSDGQIGNGEIAGDTDGDGQITEPEVAGDTNGDGQINDDEVAGDTNGDGTITAPEVSGDTNGDGQIGDGEVAGDIDGDGTITAPEIAGDTNGDGLVTSPEIIGDTDGNGIINDDEVTGDRNGDGNIGSGETAGESETEGSNIAGDTNGDGKITDTEVAGDTNGDGQIGNGEIAGDTDGDGQITDPEVAGDTDGNGQIDDDEVTGDTNGDGKITDPEVAGDTDGNGQINDDERIGDVNGDGQITAPEIAGDADGNGVINNSETAEGSIANISILSIDENTYENPDSEIYYLIDCEDESNQVAVTFTPDAYATSPHVREFNIEIPGPGLYNEEINVVSEDGINTRTYRIVVEKRFNYNDIVIQKYNNVLLINNNPATNGGYRFTAFNWYKDGGLIGTGQYYSVGDNVSDQLDLNAKYSVEIETEDGDVLRTCDFTVSYSNIFSLKVAPNPVRSGSTIDVTTTYTTDMLSDLTISVRNLYGVEVMQEMSGSNNSRITLPSSLTPGTYVVSTKAGGVELSAKIIVQ